MAVVDFNVGWRLAVSDIPSEVPRNGERLLPIASYSYAFKLFRRKSNLSCGEYSIKYLLMKKCSLTQCLWKDRVNECIKNNSQQNLIFWNFYRHFFLYNSIFFNKPNVNWCSYIDEAGTVFRSSNCFSYSAGSPRVSLWAKENDVCRKLSWWGQRLAATLHNHDTLLFIVLEEFIDSSWLEYK